jgi:hypothetical protein
MGAMNKANGRQNSKRKSRYAPYQLLGRKEINKALKLMRHLRKLPNDKVACDAFTELPELTRDKAEKIYQKLSTQ